MSYSLALIKLEGIRPVMHKQAKAAARRGDPLGIFTCNDSNDSLYLLSRNVLWFACKTIDELAPDTRQTYPLKTTAHVSAPARTDEQQSWSYHHRPLAIGV